jgi:hypothetical protein
MRALAWAVAASLAGGVLGIATPANADGGAYFQLDRTYYPVGEAASVETYVAVPERQRDVFDRGPFFAYLIPDGEFLYEREPLPRGAVRVGTFTVEDLGRGAFELRTTFEVPELDSGMYNLQLCNDPCTVAGFREPLTGLLTVAGTQAEAKLLGERDALRWRVAGMRHQLGKLKRANEELETRLDAAVLERDAIRADLAGMQAAPAVVVSASAVPPDGVDRPLVDAWALVALVGALLAAVVSVALGIVLSRRAGSAPAPGTA